MSILNTPACVSGGANTNPGDCFLELKNIARVFLVPNSFEITAADLLDQDALIQKLKDSAFADLFADRIFPLANIVGITDNTEEPVTETLGYGIPVVVRDGKYNITFRYRDGGNCLSNALRKFNSSSYRALFVDADGVLFGTRVGQTIKGVPLDYFYAMPFRFNDGSGTVANFRFNMVWAPSYINESIGFAKANIADLADVVGVINIALEATRAANVLTAKAFGGCKREDLYELYSTELAAVGNWRATQVGKTITITSVAANANAKGWTVTLDSTDPDYVAGQPVELSLAPISVLTAAGVVGYESNKISVA